MRQYFIPMRCYAIHRPDEQGRSRWKAASVDAALAVEGAPNREEAIRILSHRLVELVAAKAIYLLGDIVTTPTLTIRVAERLIIEPLGRLPWYRRWLIYTFSGWAMRWIGGPYRFTECDIFDLVLIAKEMESDKNGERRYVVSSSQRLDQYGASEYMKRYWTEDSVRLEPLTR